MDPEAPIRRHLADLLKTTFNVYQEVQLVTIDQQCIRCDLLLKPLDHDIGTIFAVEIKSVKPKQPKNYRDTFFQAYKYVGAVVSRGELSGEKVGCALICQERTTLRAVAGQSLQMTQELLDSIMNDGIELSFNSLDVGRIEIDQRNVISFMFSWNRMWCSKKSWSAEYYRRFLVDGGDCENFAK